jgi:hypothetical protein
VLAGTKTGSAHVSRLASVQRYFVRLCGIADDTLYLTDGRPRAIFAIQTADPLLLGDEELEAYTLRLEAFVHSFDQPWQLVFRLAPTDLDAHATAIDDLAASRTGRLASAGRELATYMRHLGRTSTLLQPSLYVVVGPQEPARSLALRVRDVLRPLTALRPGRRRRRAIADETQRDATAELDELGEALAAALDRLGVRWHRLDDAEIAALFGACWSPTRTRRSQATAIRQPLISHSRPLAGASR